MHYTIINAHTYQVVITDKERRLVELFVKDVESGIFSKKGASWPDDLNMPLNCTRRAVLINIKNMLREKFTKGNIALDIVCNTIRFCLSYYD